MFLGDSTTYGLKFYGMLSGGKDTNRVWTPQSGTLTLNFWKTTGIVYPETGTEIVMTEAVTLSKPEILCITLGVNGITMLDETAFKKTSDIVGPCGSQPRNKDNHKLNVSSKRFMRPKTTA